MQRTVGAWSVACALSGALLHAVIVPTHGSQSIPKLFSAASLVCKGEVRSISPVGSVAGEWYGRSAEMIVYEATVRIDRLYKGAVPGGIVTIRYSRPKGTACIVTPCVGLEAGEYNLFFLTANNGGYELVDRFFGKFPVSRLNAEQPSHGIGALEADLVVGLRDPSESAVLQSVELIGSMERVSSTAPLLNLLPTSNLRLNAAIHDALLRLKDYSRLHDVASVFHITGGDGRLRLLQVSIANSIIGIRDRDTAPALVKLAQSPSDLLREAAIHALREMGAVEAVPTFVRALDDRIKLVRYDAVLGLASIESNSDLAPSVDLFEKDERKYLAAWKQWWNETGRFRYRASVE